MKWIVGIGFAVSLFGSANRVEHLVPPILNQEAVAAEVSCIRPMREGVFNISAEDIQQKFVVHCYGHGGCGWTTFMGSVERAIELFRERYPNPSMAPPIRVIGSGCMGLCSAIELTRQGYKINGISTCELYDIPSWNAAGYFALVSVKISPQEEETVNRVNFSTFRSYQLIEKGEHPYLSSTSVRFLPVYCSPDTHAGVEELEEKGQIPPKEIVDIDFGNGMVHRNFAKYMTYFFDVTSLMQDLYKEVSRLAIPLEMKKVGSFNEVAEEVIFNCTGLGGGELAHDLKMIPVRGHLIMLSEKAGSGHMDYMIYTKVIQEGKEEYVYLFPRSFYLSSKNPEGNVCYGVMGGTFLQNADKLPAEELAQLDKSEFKRLLDRNAVFFYGKLFDECN